MYCDQCAEVKTIGSIFFFKKGTFLKAGGLMATTWVLEDNWGRSGSWASDSVEV